MDSTGRLVSADTVSDKPSGSGGSVTVSDSAQAGSSKPCPTFRGGAAAGNDHAYAIASIQSVGTGTSSVSGVPQTATVVSGGATPQGLAFATSVDLAAPVPPPPPHHVGLRERVSQPLVSPAIVASGVNSGLSQSVSTPSLGGVGMGYVGFQPSMPWPSWGSPGPSGAAFPQSGQGFNPFAAMAQGFNPFMPWQWMGQPPAAQAAGSAFQPPAVSSSAGGVRLGFLPPSSTPSPLASGSGVTAPAPSLAVSVAGVTPSTSDGKAGTSRVRAQQVRHRATDEDALSILAHESSFDSDSDGGSAVRRVTPYQESDSLVLHSQGYDSDSHSVASSALSSRPEAPSSSSSSQDLLKALERFNPNGVTSVSTKDSESSSAKAALGFRSAGSSHRLLRASPAFLSARKAVANFARGGTVDAKRKVFVEPPAPGSVPDLPNGKPMGKFVLFKPSVGLSSLVELPSGEFAASPSAPNAEDLRLLPDAKNTSQGYPAGHVPFKALSGFEALARSGLLFQSAMDHFLTGLISALKGGSVDPEAPLLVQDGVDVEAVRSFTHTIASCIESSSSILARLQLGLLQSRRDALLEHSSLCSADRTSLRSLPSDEASLFGPSFVSALLRERAQNRRDEPSTSASGSHQKSRKRAGAKSAKGPSEAKKQKPAVAVAGVEASKPKRSWPKKGKGQAGKGKPFSPQ